ncbi:hypothetical protein [Massilia timonae]|uniref:hypothetical protein n=1 Tax=Massilia timonae TaxID=47229 RepID=UPI0028D80D96|nr:hypothetical protein [Massilia timonae]
MTRDDMMDLMLGVAVVALGYALYKHHKGGQGGQTQYGNGPPITGIPAAPEIYQDAQGNYYFDMDNLFAGVF